MEILVEWLALTLGISLLSALVPLINAELFLVGMVLEQPQLSWWLVGLAAAVGQTAGKLVFYYAALGVLRLPARLRRSRSESQRGGRWSAWLDRFQQTCRDRPIWTVGVLLSAAVVGVPPFAATPIVAGVVRIPVGRFVVTGLVGRFARFSAIAVSPGLLAAWWF